MRQLEMNRLAARHFYACLKDAQYPDGLAYYQSRGLLTQTITKFGLGFAPDSFTSLRDLLFSHGFSGAEMLEAGLVIQSAKNGKYYDKFRNRVMFPVIDVKGNVVAFSGRVLDDSKPKYMNSPETLLYKKTQTVFGLNLAKQNNDALIILVEGNIDVVMLHQAGFSNAVAPLGTAFTKEQARLISKYAKTVVVAFDIDKAGIKATDKAIAYLEELGVSVRVLQMQGAKDPDEFIRKFGKDRFAMLISGARNPTEYALENLKQGLDMSNPTDRAEYLKKAVTVVAKVSGDMEREIFISSLARFAELPSETVRSAVKRERARNIKNQQTRMVEDETRKLTGVRDTVNPQRAAHLRAARAEEGIIALLAKNPDLAGLLRQKLPPEQMVTDFNRKVYALYLERLESGLSADMMMGEYFSPAETAQVVKILNTQILSDDPKGQLTDYLKVLDEEKRKSEEVSSMSAESLHERLKQMKRREE